MLQLGVSTALAAISAAALVPSSSMLIEYSTNARGYGIVCLFFMNTILVGAYALRHQNWAAWLLLAVVSALGFYTIPIMLYPFGGVVVWLLISIAIGNAQPNARSAVAGLSVATILTMLLAGNCTVQFWRSQAPRRCLPINGLRPVLLHFSPAAA